MARAPEQVSFENDFLKSIGEEETDTSKTNKEEHEFDDDEAALDDEDDLNNEQQERSLSEDDDEQEQEPRRQQQEREEPPQQEQRGSPTAVLDPFDPRAQFEDRQGSLYLGGKLVAKAGYQRKVFEGFRKTAVQSRADAKSMAGRLVQIAEGAKDLMSKFKALEANKNLFEKADISFDDQRQALDFIVAFKKNPLEGLKMILTKAQMQGVDIKQLGVAGNSFDPSVIINDIKKHVDERLKPVNEMTAASADAQRLSAETEGFFDRNPEADQFARLLPNTYTEFAEILKKAKAQNPALSLDEHWKALHYELLKQGVKLDGTTTTTRLVDDKRGQPPRNRRERRQRGTYSGSESFSDIGKDILAEISHANAQG